VTERLPPRPGEAIRRDRPITFAVDGKQYVAVATGPSGEASSTLRLTPELKPSATTQVVVFALP